VLAINPKWKRELGPGQTSGSRAYANRRLNLAELGKVQGRNMAKTPNRTWENRLSGIIGGPPETWAMVEV
jgi:hypothetical protein